VRVLASRRAARHRHTLPYLLRSLRNTCAAMRDLSPPLRDAIVAVDVLGLSYKEAARTLRIREGTVMSRLSRARDQVAGAL